MLIEYGSKKALDSLKQLFTNVPVLQYYSLQDKITLQRDALQSAWPGCNPFAQWAAIGIFIMCFNIAEMHYFQIEEERLAMCLLVNTMMCIYIYIYI